MFKPYKKQKEFISIPTNTKIVLWEGIGFGKTMEYNTDKYRLIQCVHVGCSEFHKPINSNVYPIPNCDKCNHEMICVIK